MMRIYILILLIFSTLAISAQNKQLLYNFNDLPQSLMNNPGAETSFDMHIGIPLLSQIHFSAGSSGVDLHDIFKNDGSINDRIRTQIFKMSKKDFFTVNQQLEILFLGWRDNKRRYFSGGIYQETDAFAYFPKDLALLAYEGNKNYIGRNFEFSDATFTADVLNVFHFGFTNFYSKDLNYGFRAKLYSGVFNAHSVNNRGTFRTELFPAGPNVYRHYLSGIDVLVKTAGYADLVESEDPSGAGTMTKIGKRAFLGGNLGLGIDAGFTWYPSDQYRVTGSVLDLGFINQTRNVESYRYYGNYQTDGIELLFPGSGKSPAYWDEWEDDFDRNMKDQTLTNSYITWRPVKVNASVDFGFVENAEPCNCYRPIGRRRYHNHLGLHIFAVKRPKTMNYATTISYDRTITDQIRGKVTYTVDSYSFSNVGLLFSGSFSNFNVYLAADNLLDYPNLAKARNASIQMGFQLIFNRE